MSLGAILLVLVAFPGTMLIRAGTGPADVEVLGEPAELVLSLVILGHRRRHASGCNAG